MKKIPINAAMGGVCRTIKAGYYKMGVANFLFHQNDGYAATAILVRYEADIQDNIVGSRQERQSH